MALAACSDANEPVGEGVRQLEPPVVAQGDSGSVLLTTPTDTAVSDAERVSSLLLQFAACIRENGFPDFEDLTDDAWIGLPDDSNEPGRDSRIFREEMLRRGVDVSDPEQAVVLEECGHITEEFAAYAQFKDEESAERETLLVRFARCVRENGIVDWPDPDFAANESYGYTLEDFQPFDFNSPEFQSAGQACDPEGRVLAVFMQ